MNKFALQLKKYMMYKFIIGIIFLSVAIQSHSQSFVSALDNDDFVLLFGNECIVTLNSGEELVGKLGSMTSVNGYIGKVTLKDDNKVKTKLKPEDISRIKVKAGKMMKFSMAASSTGSIKQITKTDFSEIQEREYVIFETALRNNKRAEPRLMQLLNPGFDSVIKVYTDPNAKETKGVGIGGIKLTGGEDKSYMFVINEEQSVKVKKGSYKRNFEELYADCQIMLDTFAGEKTKWADAAGHVFAYDQTCGQK